MLTGQLAYRIQKDERGAIQKPEAEHKAYEKLPSWAQLQCPDCWHWKYDNSQIKYHVDTDGGVLLVLKRPTSSECWVPAGFDRYTLRHEKRNKNDWIDDAGAHCDVRQSSELPRSEDFVVERQ